MKKGLICLILCAASGWMMNMNAENKIFKYVLKNGLTILVRSTKTIPKVSVQIFYNVGSKDEKTGQKGIAHLIEHMIFKGTETLSESDINLITHKLSGYCNAFTSFDYTGYLFDFPSHHWHEALPIMADCMRNCTFKQEYLNSEMKAVVQELKMYRDDYMSSLIEQMISTIFDDHPYHYPIIGFKQDLWSVKSKDLHDFYSYHYVPNNATLVVVGDVDPEEVLTEAEAHFGSIPANKEYTKESFYHHKDLVSKSVTLYRDVQQPMILIGFTIPGAKDKKEYVMQTLSHILADGKTSRLHKKLVDELELVTAIENVNYDLFDKGIFFIYFQPKKLEDVERIKQIIFDELESIATKGITDIELQRAAKQAEAEFLAMLENTQKQAYFIGQSYLATGDENYMFNYMKHDGSLKEQVVAIVKEYLRPSIACFGQVLPLAGKDKELWVDVQERSDQEDAKILAQALRDSEIEDGRHVHAIAKQKPKGFAFPKPAEFKLSNDLKVMHYNNPNLPKVDLILSLKAKHYYDPEEFEGLNNFMSAMLLEGTKNYTADQLAEAIENRGMKIEVSPGYVSASCLSEDLPIALELVHELMTQATFPEKNIEKVRAQILAALKNFWDKPSKFAGTLARQHIYKGHPYSKLSLGTVDVIKKIKKTDIEAVYRKWCTPHDATLAIVGDLSSIDLQKLCADKLQKWQGATVDTIAFPDVCEVTAQEVNHPMNRDQVVLAYAGKSIKRTDDLFDKLLLFDQIFTGGSLGSMSSKLFALREQSGLFYTIGGSVLSNVDEQPGMIYLRTIVSRDRLKEAEDAIQKTIDAAADSITDEEFEQARDAIINSFVDHFESNKQIATVFLFLDQFKLAHDYFDTRAEKLLSVKKDDIVKAAKQVVKSDKLVKIRIGRI